MAYRCGMKKPKRESGRPGREGSKKPLAKRSVPAQPAETSEEPERSPIFGVRKAGCGALLPLLSYPTRRVLAVTVEPTSEETKGPLPVGVLLTADTLPSAAEEVENALANPAGSLSRAMYVGRTTAGTIRFGADILLHQFSYLVAVAFEVLNRFAGVDRGLPERVRARELLDYLAEWASWAMRERSGNDAAAPLKVPAEVARASVKLAVLGRRLRHYWIELALVRDSAHENQHDQSHEAESRPRSKPLTEYESGFVRLLRTLRKGEGLTGKEVLKRLPNANTLSQSALTGRVIPGLRANGWDVPNEGRGYYLTQADRAEADRRFGGSSAAASM